MQDPASVMFLMMALDRLVEVSLMNFFWARGKFMSSWMLVRKLSDFRVHNAANAVSATFGWVIVMKETGGLVYYWDMLMEILM